MAQDKGVTIVGPAVEGNSALVYLANVDAAYGDEGTHWVRGRVTEDDDAGRALLAAFALNKEEHSPHAPVLFDFFWCPDASRC